MEEPNSHIFSPTPVDTVLYASDVKMIVNIMAARCILVKLCRHLYQFAPICRGTIRMFLNKMRREYPYYMIC